MAQDDWRRQWVGAESALAWEYDYLRRDGEDGAQVAGGSGYEQDRDRADYGRDDTPDEAAAARQALFAKVHADPRPLSALCISGGGIRSATFALGAIQGLARHGLLQRFDYLSTVSGGGYIGSWLSAWACRAGGLRGVVPGLLEDRPAQGEADEEAIDPVGHLREYNNYLSPRVGMFSADTWTVGATVLRNILLNWLVLIPLVMGVLMLPRLVLAFFAFPEVSYAEVMFSAGGAKDYAAPQLDVISDSRWVTWGLRGAMVLLFAWALFSTLRLLPGTGGERAREGGTPAFRVNVLLPLVGAVFAFLAYDSFGYLGHRYVDEARMEPVVVGTALAWLLASGAFVSMKLPELWRVRSHLARIWRHGRARPNKDDGAEKVADREWFRAALRSLLVLPSILCMAAGTGAAIWFATNYVLWDPDQAKDVPWAVYVTVAPLTVLLGYVLATMLFVGLSSGRLEDADREWMSRAAAEVLRVGVFWALLCSVVLVLPELALTWETWAGGMIASVGAASAWLSAFGSSFVAKRAQPGAGEPSRASAAVAWGMKFAPELFVAVLAVGLSILTNMLLLQVHDLPGLDAFAWTEVSAAVGADPSWRDHYLVLERSGVWLIALVAAALIASSWLAARFININAFSLQGMYRDRLVRAYPGASNPTKRSNRFTGLAPEDDLPLWELAETRMRPLHVVNVALNILNPRRLAWQQRKAQSFTLSPLHCGNPSLGYRFSCYYGGAKGISLGTAVATSGAAASPAMGYHSSPITGFVMTLFNARLGAWFGNPKADSWQHASPRSSLRWLAKEALGLASDESDYVYLSDGGHFENLALYEMVRRRCRQIVVLDSGCDPEFTYQDLGNALRKIRIDLGISIEFDEALTRPLRERERRCAVATIDYSAVDGKGARKGWLIYVKPMLLGDEPPDVATYARQNPAFPHQSTADQFFDESQTESYRMLGLHTVEQICRGLPADAALADRDAFHKWKTHVESSYLGAKGPTASPDAIALRPPLR